VVGVALDPSAAAAAEAKANWLSMESTMSNAALIMSTVDIGFGSGGCDDDLDDDDDEIDDLR